MRKIILSTAVALSALAAAPAFAADNATVAVTASLAPVCDITSVSSTLALGAPEEDVPGTFTYTCNFEGAPTFTFQSANGGVKTTENGGATVSYGIYLNDNAPSSPPSAWLQASAAQAAPVAYNGISTSFPANSSVAPEFHVGLSSALPVAGSYSDTLTITIAP